MVSYVTRDEFRSFNDDLSADQRKLLLRAAAQRSPVNATFLSHSSKDKDILPGAIRILSNHGALVYIDELDPEMPSKTTRATAELLRTRIKQSKKFVLLASSNSKESKWVPWELGLADGYKTPDNVALFPAVDSRYDTSWTSWEYMGLYKRIVWGTIDNEDNDRWLVWDHVENVAWPLENWLER